MGLILTARDIGQDIGGVKNTFSSWDSCMSKAYCKWPVIVGIIVGALIIFSLLSCLVRCLCCGVECCCGCLSCCNACCPSPRRSRQGYEQQPPQTPYQQYPMYNQKYHQPQQQPPAYASGGLGYRSTPQTATFDAPSGQKSGAHPDSLPAMPTWDTAHSRRVEREDHDDDMEDVEMEKLVSRPSPQPTSPWGHETDPLHSYGGGGVAAAGIAGAGMDNRTRSPQNPYRQQHQDAGYHASSNPYYGGGGGAQQPQYHQQQYHQQEDSYAQNPYSGHSAYSRHEQAGNYARSSSPYDNSHSPAAVTMPTYPPSYATAPSPRVASPPAAATSQGFRPPSGLQIGRKPLQGSWREV